MGTEHLKPRATTPPTNQEIAEQAIDRLEDIGYSLLPWQAEALRAILTHPVDVPPRRQPPSSCLCLGVNGLAFDWRCGDCGLEHKAVKTQARGSRADYVVMDEPKRCNTFHLTVEDMRQCPEHGQGY
jgi:hypothetical protein